MLDLKKMKQRDEIEDSLQKQMEDMEGSAGFNKDVNFKWTVLSTVMPSVFLHLLQSDIASKGSVLYQNQTALLSKDHQQE